MNPLNSPEFDAVYGPLVGVMHAISPEEMKRIKERERSRANYHKRKFSQITSAKKAS